MQFIQARNYGPHRGVADIRWIVIHTMQAPEKPYTARSVAHWFASSSAPKASAHYCIDSLEVIECVHESDVAWGAPGANRYGVHLEHAGYAEQTPDEWNDDYTTACLGRSAELASRIAQRYGIPFRRLTPAELKAGQKGFCGHIDCTIAFSGGKGHTDPGAWFPWDRYLALCQGAELAPAFSEREALTADTKPAPPHPDDDECPETPRST
jgi:N-acetyl-anhydromuramyl-L-alanine amidase AmpD